ncbi:MAG TPA: hypothetical protein VF332_09295 [Vicinamibacterales bacterium]|jgi:hypothetical protein
MSWVLWLLVVATVVVLAAWFGRRYLKLRGPRLVECPETNAPAAVNIRTAQAAMGQHFSLSDCSRWPEKQSCGRECLAQIERAPAECLIRSVVTKWYAGKSCAVCHKPLGEIDWFERKPGLLDGSGRARPWRDVPPEELPETLAHEQPICFDCYVAATFRQEHPELVLDNPWKP